MNEITTTRNIISSMDDAERAARAMAGSGFFQDTRQANQAIVKILAGQELGFGPFASMTGIHIIQGRPAFGANLLAAAVKKSGKYNYKVLEMTDSACEIAFFEQGQECGRSRFTMDDARKAGTKNMDKFPKNMLFARAMSNGVRWHCPDVTGSGPVYTPEELGADVDQDGNVLETETIQTQPAAEIHVAVEPTAEIPQTYAEACAVQNSAGVLYGDIPSDKLGFIASNPKTPPAKRRAAEIILAERK